MRTLNSATRQELHLVVADHLKDCSHGLGAVGVGGAPVVALLLPHARKHAVALSDESLRPRFAPPQARVSLLPRADSPSLVGQSQLALGAAASRSGSETSHTAAPQMLNPSVRMVARPRSGRCPSRLRMSAATDAVALELAGYWHCHACAVLTLPSCRQRLQLRRHGELQPAAEFAAFNSVSCTQKILSVSGLQLHSDRQ